MAKRTHEDDGQDYDAADEQEPVVTVDDETMLRDAQLLDLHEAGF